MAQSRGGSGGALWYYRVPCARGSVRGRPGAGILGLKAMWLSLALAFIRDLITPFSGFLICMAQERG